MRASRGKRTAFVSLALTLVILGMSAWFLWPHVLFWRLFEALGKNAQGYFEYRHRQTGIVMVRVPEGILEMGSSESELESVVRHWLPFDTKFRNFLNSRMPEQMRQDLITESRLRDMVRRVEKHHVVSLRSFLIAKHEVTQAVWARAMGCKPPTNETENDPASRISWYEWHDFCTKTHLCFPTEAQWEYAARAGNKAVFWWGNSLPDFGKDTDLTRFRTRFEALPSGWNLFGLLGLYEGEEWCEDYYDEDFYSAPEATEKDPVCKRETDQRSIRGACVWYSPLTWRFAARFGMDPDDKAVNDTFRPAYYPLP